MYKLGAKIGALQNCRILFYAYFGILYNLPSKKNPPPQLAIFYFPPIFSRRHLPPPVSGVDASESSVETHLLWVGYIIITLLQIVCGMCQ